MKMQTIQVKIKDKWRTVRFLIRKNGKTIMYIGANDDDDDESEDDDINNGSVSDNAHGLLPFFIGNGLG